MPLRNNEEVKITLRWQTVFANCNLYVNCTNFYKMQILLEALFSLHFRAQGSFLSLLENNAQITDTQAS